MLEGPRPPLALGRVFNACGVSETFGPTVTGPLELVFELSSAAQVCPCLASRHRRFGASFEKGAEWNGNATAAFVAFFFVSGFRSGLEARRRLSFDACLRIISF